MTTAENVVLIGLELENCCLVGWGESTGGEDFSKWGDEQIFSWWWGGTDSPISPSRENPDIVYKR